MTLINSEFTEQKQYYSSLLGVKFSNSSKDFFYQNIDLRLLGFLKKLKETAEKGLEKGVELGTKGYDSAMEAAKKGYENAREESTHNYEPPFAEKQDQQQQEPFLSPLEEAPAQETKVQTNSDDSIQILKLRFVKGEITKEQFEEMKNMLQESAPNPLTDTMPKNLDSTVVLPGSGKAQLDWVRSLPLIKKNKWKEALQDFEKSIKNNPNDAKAWYGKGFALNGLQKYEEAIIASDQAFSIDPINSAALHTKAKAHDALGRREAALRDCDQALSIDPSFAEAWHVKGSILWDLDRFEESLECSEQATKVEPENYMGWSDKGWALKKLGRGRESNNCFEKTIMLCDQALSIDENDDDTWSVKGNALSGLGREKESEKAMKMAKKLRS